jgi:hypothetical protein
MALTKVGAGVLNIDDLYGFRNRIINGDMRIDQRNAGASVTPTTDMNTLDRWRFGISQSSKFSTQQNAGSVTPPVGFTNYLGVTSLSSYSITSGDIFGLYQRIEGYNTADLAWGTANAKAVTLFFQVYSSLTGTFGGSLQNNVADRTYPFTYTISSANTWTSIAVTIPGDTTGTWLTNNGTGIKVTFGLGLGSSVTAPAGAWTGTSGLWGANGCVSIVGTNGATFFITGVQLEVGTVATPFERRPFGTELALCQRYYYKLFPAAANRILAMGQVNNSTEAEFYAPFAVTMRTRPTALETNGTASDYKVYSADANTAATTVIYLAGTTDYSAVVRFTVASGLTAGRAASAQTNTGATTAFLAWSAEL